MKVKEAQEVIEKLEREASLLEIVLSVSGRLNQYIYLPVVAAMEHAIHVIRNPRTLEEMENAAKTLREEADFLKSNPLFSTIGYRYMSTARMMRKAAAFIEKNLSVCGNCGKVIEDSGYKFCPYCGKQIKWRDSSD